MDELRNEQEQVDALKAWWAAYGKFAIACLLVAMVAVVGFHFWQVRSQERELIRSEIYWQVLSDMDQRVPSTQVVPVIQQLMQTDPHSIQASFSALMLSKLQVEQNDLAGASQTLNWVVQNTQDPFVQKLSRLRLARVQLALQQPDQALKTLAEISGDPMASFLRGEVEMSLNHPQAALVAYQEAMKGLPVGSPLYQLIQLKING